MLHPIIKIIADEIEKASIDKSLSVEEVMEQLSISRDLAFAGFNHAGVHPRPLLIKTCKDGVNE